MKKTILIFIAAVALTFSTQAQNQNEIDKRSDWQERIFMGGNMGLQFGQDTYVNLSPTMGYRITNEVSAGVGVSYIYTKRFNQSRTHYGGNVFSRVNLFDPFFAMAQYEYLSVDIGAEGKRLGLKSFLVGGGVQQPLGGNAVASFTVMYNLSYVEGEPSAYNSPIVIGGGITLGF